MAKAKKATRKFKAQHLDRTIAKRKASHNKKAKAHISTPRTATATVGKKRGREEEKAGVEADDAAASTSKDATSQRVNTDVEELDVDEFLQSGLLAGGDDDEGEEMEEGEDGEGGDDDDDDPLVLETDGASNGHNGTVDNDEADGDEGDEEQRLMAEIAEHEADMRALAKKDPAFYQHLQDNDAELLHFSKEDVMADEDAEDGADGTAKSKTAKAKPKESSAELSLPAWRALKKQVTSVHSLTALRKVLRLFRTAAHSNDDEKVGEESAATLRLTSSTLYTDVIRFAVNSVPSTFTHHLPIPTKSPLTVHPRFKVLGPLLKSYLTSYIHLLSTLHDPQLIRLLLSTLLSTLNPLLSPFPKLSHRLLKPLLTLWSTADRSTRIDSFLCIRQLCLTLTRHGLLEESMKAIYLTYVQYARWTTAVNVGVLDFMSNCIVELYGMDGGMAYQHAFVYIRQLAIHLRNAQHNGKGGGPAGGGEGGGGRRKGWEGKKKGGEKAAKGGGDAGGHKLVYNWQFVNCLRVWTKVLASPLAAHPVSSSSSNSSSSAPATLRPLLYPFVQICLGVATLLPSSRYHPLRLVVCDFLLTLSSSCHLSIPVPPILLSLFSSAELTRRPSSSTTRSPDLRYTLRVSKATATSRAYQEQLCTHALRLLIRSATIHSYSLAYPELILPTLRFLRRWVKRSRIHRLNQQIGGVVTQLEWNAEWCRKRREGSEWTPKDALEGRVDGMYAWRGLGGEEEGGEKGKEGVSPLERYARMERGEVEGEKEVDEKDMDWDGSQSKGKRRSGDDGGEEEEDEGKGEGEEQEEGDEDGDGQEDDEEGMMEDSDEEDEGDERRPQPSSLRKKQRQGKAAAAAPSAAQKGPPKGPPKKAEKSTQPLKHGQQTKAETSGIKKQKVAVDDAAATGEDIVTELVLSDDDD